MNIKIEGHPPTDQKPYALLLKHTQSVKEEFKVSEMSGIITNSVSSWSSPIVIVPQKAQPSEISQK